MKTTAAVAGAAALGTPFIARAQQAVPEVINVGHFVGIPGCRRCSMATPLGMFKAEGLDVELKFMPNPGDGLTALVSGAIQVAHLPFTNAVVAADTTARRCAPSQARRRRHLPARPEGDRHQVVWPT